MRSQPLLRGLASRAFLPPSPLVNAPNRVTGRLPDVARSPCVTACSFSTSRAVLRRGTRGLAAKRKVTNKKPNRDYSKNRGRSTLRRTGLRWRLSTSDVPLPMPTARGQLHGIKTDENHGLWDFFYNRERLVDSPVQQSSHGREWTVEELRGKSWDDLHRLWWVCVKERNRIATTNIERRDSDLGYGRVEAGKRDIMVRLTMRNIKHTLTERYYVWEDAVKLARDDPEVRFTEHGVEFLPEESFEDEEVVSDEEGASDHGVASDEKLAPGEESAFNEKGPSDDKGASENEGPSDKELDAGEKVASENEGPSDKKPDSHEKLSPGEESAFNEKGPENEEPSDKELDAGEKVASENEGPSDKEPDSHEKLAPGEELASSEQGLSDQNVASDKSQDTAEKSARR